jgi:steroid 5-alpha reductase family enzyme
MSVALAGVALVLWLVWIGALQAFRRQRDLKVGSPTEFGLALFPVVVAAAFVLAPVGSTFQEFLDLYLHFGLLILAMLGFVWLVSIVIRNSSIMDIVYPLGAAAPAIALMVWRGAWSAHHIVLMLALLLWSLRLSIHVAHRNIGRGEDARYAAWRKRFGPAWWWWSFFQVFALQGVLVWIWSIPIVLAIAAQPSGLGAPHWLALAVFLVGFCFQAVGDWQLARFIRTRTDRHSVLDTGLWSLTRHPNYFGEVVIWWSFWLLALTHPWGLLSVMSPAHVTWFMSKGSATPMQERYLAKTKPAYADYARRVPAFFPWSRP